MSGRDAETNQKIRSIARSLLSYESTADAGPETDIAATYRVLEALRRRLCTVVGVQGFRVLLTRALTLARARVPRLSEVTVNPDGSLTGLSALPAEEIPIAGFVLTAQLLELLATFIGEGLTLRILLSVWPDVTVLDTIGSGETE
jgi:hypothetical protein